MANHPRDLSAPVTRPELGHGALIVSPTYNERANLEAFVEATLGVAPGAHVLIVEDNSPDGTGQLADEMAARDSRVRVLHRPSKLGIGAAYAAAFKSNGYSFQIEMTYRALQHGLKVVEVPIVFVDRRVGESKMDGQIFLEAVSAVWRLRLGTLFGRRC